MSITAANHSSRRNIFLLCRSVVIENLRRREFSVVLLFMGLFLVSILVVRYLGIKNQANVAFLLNLGLSLSCLFAQAVTLLSAARQFPNEVENRTLYPLMAKPVRRTEYVFAKVFASSAVGWVTLAILLLMATLPIPHLQESSSVLFVEMIVLQFLGIAVVASLAFLGSLLIPHVLNLLLVALVVLAGSRISGLIDSAFVMKPSHAAVRWFTDYIPNFSLFDLVNIYTVGASPLLPVDFVARLVYAAILIFAPLAISIYLMERRQI